MYSHLLSANIVKNCCKIKLCPTCGMGTNNKEVFCDETCRKFFYAGYEFSKWYFASYATDIEKALAGMDLIRHVKMEKERWLCPVCNLSMKGNNAIKHLERSALRKSKNARAHLALRKKLSTR